MPLPSTSQDLDDQTSNNELKPPSQLLSLDPSNKFHPRYILEDKLRKCLSVKAVKIGKEHGVTAEFIIQQTSEQFCATMEDLYMTLDCLQDCLYGNESQVVANS